MIATYVFFHSHVYSSEPFLTFRPKLKALQDAGLVTIDGESFLDSNIGFGDRA